MSITSMDGVNYESKNHLRWRLEPNTQQNISGGGGYISHTAAHYHQIATSHDVVSYTLKIRYEGSVDLADRNITEITIPDPALDPQVVSNARYNVDQDGSKTGKAKCLKIASAVTMFIPVAMCVAWPCLFCASYSANKELEDLISSETNRLARETLASKINEHLKDADSLATERIKPYNQKHKKDTEIQ